MFRQLFQSAQPLSANAFQETKCFLEVKESGNASNRPVELLLPCSEGHVLPLQCWLPASASTMPVKAGSASAACTVQAVVKLFKLIQPPDCLVEVQLCTCKLCVQHLLSTALDACNHPAAALAILRMWLLHSGFTIWLLALWQLKASTDILGPRPIGCEIHML